ncbi:MAG: hypothetical protein LBD99_07690, partial [Candidatus Margulisbacteria bacterium]|nr:hypothetical protein [Candidatus Margulisiibacteriota bacterium]
SLLLNQAKLGSKQAAETLRQLLAADRAARTADEVGEDSFKQIEPRLELDAAWNSLDDKYNGYLPANINAEAVAKKYLVSADAGTRAEAEDLLRLVWSKGADPQRAIDGAAINIGDESTPVEIKIEGYATLAKKENLADKRVRGAFDNLISLYTYNPLTCDTGQLDGLVKNLQIAYEASPNDLRIKELYVKALLAQAETYYQDKKTDAMAKTLDILLKREDGVPGGYSGLLAGEINVPEKTAQYYAYCEQRVRLFLKQAQDSNRATREISDGLNALRREFNLISPAALPTGLTEKLLDAFITVNKPDVIPADVMSDLGFGETFNNGDIEKYFVETCRTEYQRRLFIGILCALANLTAGDNQEDLVKHGDNDVYEQTVETLLLDGQYMPTARALKLLGSEYAATIRPRLRLGMVWTGLTGEDKESVDHVLSPQGLAVAGATLESIRKENKEGADDQTKAQKTLLAELKNEMAALHYFVLIKSKYPEQITEALRDYYLPQIEKNPEDAEARALIASAYAYDLRDYDEVLKYIDAKIQSGETLDPVLFSIVVDCWNKQEPKTAIPKNIVENYIAAAAGFSSDKTKTALANIICAYVAQQLENDDISSVDLLDKVLLNLEHSPLARGYIENRIKTLQAKALIIQGAYEKASELLNGADKENGVPLSGAAGNGWFFNAVYTPVGFNAGNTGNGFGAILAQADLGEARAEGGISGILKKLEPYKDKLEPQPFAYLYNDALRQSAQIAEAQGDYETALEFLNSLPQAEKDYPGDDPQEKTRAWLYDQLQRTGVLYARGARAASDTPADYTKAQELLDEVLKQNASLPPKDQGLVYFKLLDLAFSEEQKEQTCANPAIAEGYLERLKQLDEVGQLKTENKLLYQLQLAAYHGLLFDRTNRAAALAEAETLANTLTSTLPIKAAEYRALIANLRKYDSLELRNFAEITSTDAPNFAKFNYTDGLKDEEYILAARTICLNSLVTQGNADALAGIEKDLKSFTTKTKSNLTELSAEFFSRIETSQGLQNLARVYLTELLLLKYTFLRSHCRFDTNGKMNEQDEADLKNLETDLDAAIKLLPNVKQLDFNKRLDALRNNVADIAPYDILADELEKAFVDLEAYAAGPTEFWQFKKKLDAVLNYAVLLNSDEELILAIDILYGLDLNIAVSDYPAGRIMSQVSSFRGKMTAELPGFKFTPEEKGYGYYLLLKLLKNDPR